MTHAGRGAFAIFTVALACTCALAAWSGCSRRAPSDPVWREGEMAWRRAKDDFLRSAESPLPEADRAGFAGLAYFPLDERWIATADFAPAPPETLILATSTGVLENHVRVGTARFALAARACSLGVFRGGDDERFFVPFTDRTSGDATYGGGRYLDVDPPAGARLRLDFNRAYNPYCAYGPGWVCPLPPAENRLDVAVEAGERRYAGAH